MLFDFLAGWQVGALAGCLVGRVAGWQVGWLAVWLVDRLASLLVGRLAIQYNTIQDNTIQCKPPQDSPGPSMTPQVPPKNPSRTPQGARKKFGFYCREAVEMTRLFIDLNEVVENTQKTC